MAYLTCRVHTHQLIPIQQARRRVDSRLEYSFCPTPLDPVCAGGAGILAVKCGPVFAGLTAGTIAAYTAYTLGVTQWRIQFRQAMNTADSEASARATDSLINYETVKLYGNEAHERRRYDECLAGARGQARVIRVAGSGVGW